MLILTVLVSLVSYHLSHAVTSFCHLSSVSNRIKLKRTRCKKTNVNKAEYRVNGISWWHHVSSIPHILIYNTVPRTQLSRLFIYSNYFWNILIMFLFFKCFVHNSTGWVVLFTVMISKSIVIDVLHYKDVVVVRITLVQVQERLYLFLIFLRVLEYPQPDKWSRWLHHWLGGPPHHIDICGPAKINGLILL